MAIAPNAGLETAGNRPENCVDDVPDLRHRAERDEGDEGREQAVLEQVLTLFERRNLPVWQGSSARRRLLVTAWTTLQALIRVLRVRRDVGIDFRSQEVTRFRAT